MPFPTTVDNTMRKTLVRCQQMAAWKHLYGFQPAVSEANIHLAAGRAFAAGIAAARLAYHDKGAHPFDALQAGLEALRANYAYSGPVPMYCYKTLDRMEGALAFYLDKWPLATDERQVLRLNDGRWAVELGETFELPVLHPDTDKLLRYTANFDTLLEDRQGRVWVIDEKTTGKMGDAWALQWTLDSQLTGYVFAATLLLRRLGMTQPVVGAVVRGIAIHKADYQGMECLELRHEWEIERWHDQMCRDFERLAVAYKDRSGFDRVLDHACALYNAPCEYATLCKARDPLRIAETTYQVRFYDPLNRD